MVLNNNNITYKENLVNIGNSYMTVDGIPTNLGYNNLVISDSSFSFTTSWISLNEANSLINNNNNAYQINSVNSKFYLNDFFPGLYATEETLNSGNGFESGGPSGGGSYSEVFPKYRGTQLSQAILPYCCTSGFYEYDDSGMPDSPNGSFNWVALYSINYAYRINPWTVLLIKTTTQTDNGSVGALKIVLNQNNRIFSFLQ